LPPGSACLAEDETDLLLFPPLRAGWAKRGEPFEVPLSGANARRVVFGALNLVTGRRMFVVRRRQRAEDFRALLGEVRRHYRGRPVVLLADEDSSHTAGGSQREAAHLGIELLWLPKKSPQLNPADHLWRHAKQEVCANRQYGSIEEQVDWFLDYLLALSPQEALRKAGVLSENFWLRSALCHLL
jgi:transposase